MFTESFFLGASYEEAFGPVARTGFFFLGPSFCIELRLGSSMRVFLSDERRSMGRRGIVLGRGKCMDCIIGLGIGVSFLSRLGRKAFSSWSLCSLVVLTSMMRRHWLCLESIPETSVGVLTLNRPHHVTGRLKDMGLSVMGTLSYVS